MTFQVVAACVIAKDQAGKLHHVYEGGVIPWLSPEQAKHFLAENLVVKMGSAPAEDDDDSGDGVPLRAAPKAEWVDYAISKGADPEEAEASTKAELIELYGG